MLQAEHSAILSTFIKLPFAIKIFVLSILSIRFTQVLLYQLMQIIFWIDCNQEVTVFMNYFNAKFQAKCVLDVLQVIL